MINAYRPVLVSLVLVTWNLPVFTSAKLVRYVFVAISLFLCLLVC